MSGATSPSSSPTTTTTTSDPWSAQQPMLKQELSSAQNLYNTGQLAPSYFSGPTIAAQSPQTTGAIQASTAFGNNYSLDNQTANTTGQLMDPNFMLNTPGNSTFQNMSNSRNPALGAAAMNAYNPAGAGTLSNLSTNGTPMSINSNLGNIAAGGLVGQNPFLQQQMQNANANIANTYQTSTAPGVDASLERAGRYGTGALDTAQANSQRDLASQLSTADTTLLGNDYEQQVQNQMGAAGAIQNANLTNTGQEAGAASSLGGLVNQSIAGLGTQYGQQASVQGAGATGLGTNFNNSTTNMMKETSLAPAVNNMPQTQIAALANAGQTTDQYQQSLINAAMQEYNYNSTLPASSLASYDQLIQGNYGGTSVSQGQAFGPSPLSQFSSLLGAGASAAGAGVALASL
jgi:hypothetical protein